MNDYRRTRPLSRLSRFPGMHVFTLLVAMLLAGSAVAQRAVTGQVTDSETGTPMAGVTVVVKGSTAGAFTDDEGQYSVRVASNEDVLVFTFIGYQRQEVTVGSQTSVSVGLVQTGVELDDVVITALGITREKKALGYSVTEVAGESLTEARENNVVNSLAGRVAGVNISSTAGGPASSTRVIIRGNASLGGNNQPLYVVDGIPLDNSNLGSAGMWGGKDLGDGISSINPDDIETISVLKGPSATALYGTRAQNGVILITTKKGRARKGIGVELNSNYVVERPLVLYDFQQEYGQGDRGEAPTTVDEAIETARASWGSRMDGRPVINFDGVSRPYSPNPNNLLDFYDMGSTFTNTLSLAGGNETSTFRFSASDLRNNGLVPESGLNRNTFTLRGTSKLGNRLSVDVKANYVIEKAENRPSLSDTPENPGLVLTEMASNIPVSALETYKDEFGNYIPWNNSIFRVNPYWGVYEQTNFDQKDRFIGFMTLRYEFTNWLSLQLRAGTDFYTFRQTDIDGFGTPYVDRGRITENEWRVRETNADFLLLANKEFGDFSISATLGGNRMDQSREQLRLFGGNFSIPNLQTVANGEIQEIGYNISPRRINSFYGSAQLGFRNYLYLELAARNDWSSTLPVDNNSYFYPSASLSYVITDALKINSEVFSFGKVRFSYAQVGGDTDPFNLDLTYGLSGQPHLGYPIGAIAQGFVPNNALEPSLTTSWEAGTDLRFFNNRVSLDLAVYDMVTDKQIVSNTISQTTGYGSAVINTGKIRNRGIEALLMATPVSTQGGFKWEVGFNFARNVNEVLTLNPSDTTLKAIRLGESRQRNTYVEARLGEPYGAIVGFAYLRDDNGNIVYNDAGMPRATPDLQVLGVGVPAWTGGLTNTFTYKGIMASALIDMRFGGVVHSMTNLRAYATGTHMETLEGRENGLTVTGVRQTGTTADGDPIYEDFSFTHAAEDVQDYYGTVSSQISEEFIYDASFMKLRQVTIGYNIPSSVLERTPFQGISVSLVGRNLAFLYRNVPNIDPESNYNNSNAQGLEYGTLPTPRSLGFNVNVKF